MPPQITPRLPYICARCLRSATSAPSKSLPKARTNASPRSYSTSTSQPPILAPSGHTHLTHRRLLILHGPDVTHFLHGITTASIRHGLTTGFYSTFLTAQGRILHDVFVYPCSHSSAYTSRLPSANAKYKPEDPAFFIECDATQTGALLRHLRRYKLRANFEMREVNVGEWDVYSYWDGEERWTAHSPPTQSTGAGASASSEDSTSRIGARDARAPGMGHRLILPGTSNFNTDIHTQTATPSAPLSTYHIRRILRGVPENQSTGEIASNATLPHEMNIDLMSGIDFKKGCYVGQELTIRTQHTGIVRKRVLPVMLYPAGSKPPERLEYVPTDMSTDTETDTLVSESNGAPSIQSGTAILPLPLSTTTHTTSKARPRPAGKILTSIGNIGLGLCRIEKMTDVVLTAESSSWSADEEFYLPLPAQDEDRSEGRGMDKHEGGVRVKAFVPDWIRNQIKVREPQRRVE